MNDDAFDRLIRERLEGVRQRRGACPDGDTLGQYAQGQLNSEQAEVVTRHIAACGRCDQILTRMKTFDAPPAATSLWDRLHWMRHPALGWAVALVLAVPAWRAWQTSVPPASPEVQVDKAAAPGVRPVAVVNLNRTRGSANGVAKAGSQVVLLDFFAPTKAEATYTVKLKSGSTEITQPISSWDGLGNYHLLVDDPRLLVGPCQLVVIEHPKSGPSLDAATFDCSR